MPPLRMPIWCSVASCRSSSPTSLGRMRCGPSSGVEAAAISILAESHKDIRNMLAPQDQPLDTEAARAALEELASQINASSPGQPDKSVDEVCHTNNCGVASAFGKYMSACVLTDTGCHGRWLRRLRWASCASPTRPCAGRSAR